MKTRNSHGFTLIEIILSLAIFALISVGFLGMFSTVFISTFRSTEITESAFLAQQEIEDEIADVKLSLEGNTAPTGYTSSTVTLFSGSNARNVTVYKLTQDINSNIALVTLIAQNRPPVLQTPVIEGGVSIAAFSSMTEVAYPNIAMSDLSIDLRDEIEVDNPGLLIRYLYYWYISNPGDYNASSTPVFPDDYEIIPDHVSRIIPSIPESYAGRFIKLVVTPVGEKGRMGTSVESNALYISKMPLNTNLVLLLDANYVVKDDQNQVRNVTSGTQVTSYIKKWYDLSSQNSSLLQSTDSYQPVIHQITTGEEDNTREFLGILGSSVTSGVNLKQATSPTVGSISDMTVYFVAKFEDALPASFTLFQSRYGSTSGNKWLLKTDDDDQLVLTRYLDGTTASKTRSITSTNLTYRDGDWKIFKLNIWKNHLSIEMNGTVIGTVDYDVSTTQTMQLSEFRINFNSNFVVSELMVYSTIHAAGSTQANLINQYLLEKYFPSQD